jgi:hypothetical protein
MKHMGTVTTAGALFEELSARPAEELIELPVLPIQQGGWTFVAFLDERGRYFERARRGKVERWFRFRE